MALFRRIANLFRRARLDQEIAEELKAHLDLRMEENIERGMTPAQARRDARVRFGNLAATQERVAGADAALTFGSVACDVRYSLRQLRANPGFAATAVLALAIGIGACVTTFAFVDAALIKPLPYHVPTRIVALYESMSLGPRFHISYLDYLDWKRLNQVFSSVDIYDGSMLRLTTRSGIEPVDGGSVSATFFHTLGVTPMLGRDFRPGEDLPGTARTALLSYGAWQKRFGGRPDISGQTVTLNDTTYTIVGVLPADFHFALVGPADFWVTAHADDGCAKERGCHNFSGIARLKDGVSLRQAQANLSAVADQLAATYPDEDAHRGATVLPLSEVIVGSMRAVLITLLAGAGLLLIIACVNVSSLMMVRAQSRRREIAVRGALGASTARIVMQLTTEGLVLVGGSLSIALFAARFAMRLLLGLLPASALGSMPYLQQLGLCAHSLLFAALLSLLAAGLVCGLPVMRLCRVGSGPEMRDALASTGRGFAGSRSNRFGAHLVVAELAVAMILLVGAGLLAKSFFLLLHTEIGLVPEHLVAMRISAETPRYDKDPDVIALQRRVAAAVRVLPGIQSAGITLRLPIGPPGGSTTFRVIGRPYHGERIEVVGRNVDPGYFPTIGAVNLRGRNFVDSDDAAAPRVMIINRALARKFFPGEDPIGHKIAYDAKDPGKLIVGIVNDIQEGPLDDAAQPVMYVPVAQETWARFYVVVRTSVSASESATMLSEAISKIDPTLTLFPVESMNQRIQDSPAAYLHRSSAWMVGAFAVMALLLGVVGVYGVIAYSVSQRTREIGVRMALGARRIAVYKMILSDAGRLTLRGIGCGAVCAVIASMLMRRLLFNVSPWDAATLLGVSAALAFFAMAASFLPAYRAAGIDPSRALRSE